MRRIFEIQHEEVVPSHSVKLVRLATGKLLTARLLPLSKNQTTIECNLYTRGSSDSASTKTEVEELKSTLQAKVVDLEAHHRKILGGKAKFDDGKDSQHISRRHCTLSLTALSPNRRYSPPLGRSPQC
jgi:hypothetical protein